MAKTQFGPDAQQQNAMAQRQRADKNKWDEMLAMLQFAHKGDPETMLGFGLGRLLRDGFTTWLNNYKARDKAKTEQAWQDYQKTDRSMPFDDYRQQWYDNYDANRNQKGAAQTEMQNTTGENPMPAASAMPGLLGDPAILAMYSTERPSASALAQSAAENWEEAMNPEAKYDWRKNRSTQTNWLRG